MVKIKKVCELTGLSEKAVRLYINEGLIKPVIEEGISYKSYSFSDENIDELNAIAILRGAGFSIDEIRTMNNFPERIHSLISERQNLLMDELDAKEKLATSLSRLTSGEQSDIRALAKAVEPSVAHRDNKNTPKSERNYKFILGFLLILIVTAIYIRLTDVVSFELVGGLCLIILGTLCVIYSFYCFRITKKAAGFDHRAVGTVIDVVEDHGFNISFARAGANHATSSENGIGGIWQFFSLLWNEMRPDCFYPLVGFYNSGKYVLAQLPFGWLKSTWNLEEEIEIAWNGDNVDYVLPLVGAWIKVKAWSYLGVGIISLAVSAIILNGIEL